MTTQEIADAVAREDLKGVPGGIAEYEKMLAKGCSPGFAAMLILRSPPRLMTDAVYTSGQGTLQKQFDGQEQVLERIVKVAKQHGYNPNANDIYEKSLARFQGDPEAFVPAGDACGHIQKICNKRGVAPLDAPLNVKSKYRSPESDPHKTEKKGLAKDILNKKTREFLDKVPEKKRRELKSADIRKLREALTDRHGS